MAINLTDAEDPAALNTNIKRETDINTAGDSFETSLRAYFPVVYNNKLIFSANDGVTGLELWEYDGINQPTMLPEINTSGDIADGEVSSSEKVILNDKVYFAADDGVNGSELWVYFEK